VINGSGGEENELLFVTCDPGDIALNGGVTAVDEEDVVNDIMPSTGSIIIEVRDNGEKGIFRANIICMDSASPHRPVE
jgi:hypothetical protein